VPSVRPMIGLRSTGAQPVSSKVMAAARASSFTIRG
jgi:hypothetical protein